MSGTIRLLPFYAYMAWGREKCIIIIIIIIIIADLITLFRMYVLGNFHLSQIVSGISFNQGKEIRPIIIIIIIIIFSRVTGPFFLSLLLLNQR